MDDSPVRVFFRNKWVRLVLIIDALLLIAIIVIAIITALRSSILTLNITPVDSKILVNGKEYKNGSYSFLPGTYEVKISHENLDEKTLNVTLNSSHDLTVAAFLKSSTDDFEFYTLKENYDSFLILEEIASMSNNQTYDFDQSAGEFIKDIREKYDALDGVLPIEHQEYINGPDGQELDKDITIKRNYDDECETYLCLKALALGTRDIHFINSFIIEKGLNPEDYEIIYKVY